MMALIAPTLRRGALALGVFALVTGLAACAARTEIPNIADRDADKFLLDRGNEALARRRWFEARNYFQTLFDTYPQSPHRQDAKLGIGDSYLGEPGADSHVLAANQFREFLQFYALSPRADYAQYKLAMAEKRQMLSPQRDQTATINALREFDTFVRRFPTSSLMPEVLKMRREVRDRLSEHEFIVGRQYFRQRWYPGALARLDALLKADPEYTYRDAAYYVLGQTLARMERTDDALTYYEKLIEEFAVSEYLDDARKRIAELKTPAATR